jgi:hypothetical protein
MTEARLHCRGPTAVGGLALTIPLMSATSISCTVITMWAPMLRWPRHGPNSGDGLPLPRFRLCAAAISGGTVGKASIGTTAAIMVPVVLGAAHFAERGISGDNRIIHRGMVRRSAISATKPGILRNLPVVSGARHPGSLRVPSATTRFLGPGIANNSGRVVLPSETLPAANAALLGFTSSVF